MDGEKETTVSQKDLKTIAEFVSSVRYGSVSIVIQDGKIVQIEKNEKVRLK